MRYLSMFKDCLIRGGTGADPGTGVRPDIGVVILRCRDGTCGGAWIGVVFQIRIAVIVHFLAVTRIKSLQRRVTTPMSGRTPVPGSAPVPPRVGQSLNMLRYRIEVSGEYWST